MSLIFENSCLATKSELDLFTNASTMAALDDGWTTEYLPTTAINDSSPIKFFVSGDTNHYIDANCTYLYLEVKVTTNAGANLAENAAVGPINLLAHSLFQQVDIWLNDTLITNASNLYHYRAILETLLSYSKESKTSSLTMSLYEKDTAGKMDSLTENAGLTTRKAYIKESKTLPLICKIHSDIFFQKRLLLNGVDLKLKLVRNSDKLVLMAAENATFKVKVINASLFVRKVAVNNGIQLQHIEMLDKKLVPAIYPIRRVDMKTINIATGSLSMNDENLFNGILPKRIVLGFVKSTAFEGAYNLNPFNFTHENLKYCSLLVNGKMVPQKPLVSDFTNGNTIRNYFSLLESTGHAFNNTGIDINRTEYETGYSLLAFDFTPDISDQEDSFHLLKKGVIRLEIKFATALTEPVNIICYSEFDSAIKIDKNRSVITNFYG